MVQPYTTYLDFPWTQQMVLQLFLEAVQYYPQYDSSPSEHTTLTVGTRIASIHVHTQLYLKFKDLQWHSSFRCRHMSPLLMHWQLYHHQCTRCLQFEEGKMHHCKKITFWSELAHAMEMVFIYWPLHSPMRELSEGWGNDSGFSNHTLTTNVDISEVPADNTTTLNYGLCMRMKDMVRPGKLHL